MYILYVCVFGQSLSSECAVSGMLEWLDYDVGDKADARSCRNVRRVGDPSIKAKPSSKESRSSGMYEDGECKSSG